MLSYNYVARNTATGQQVKASVEAESEAAAAKVKDALKDSLAELGKSGSNLNQIAYMLNANTAPARIMNIIENAINEHNALVARHEAASKDLDELRTMAMDALGLER